MKERDKLVAERIMKYVTENGIKHRWLCKKAGICEGSLSRKLHGLTEFTLCEAWDIANALGLDIAYFFE